MRPLVATVSQGAIVITETWIFDAETGTLGGAEALGEIQWDRQTAIQHRTLPAAGAKIVNLGHVGWNSVTARSHERIDIARMLHAQY